MGSIAAENKVHGPLFYRPLIKLSVVLPVDIFLWWNPFLSFKIVRPTLSWLYITFFFTFLWERLTTMNISEIFKKTKKKTFHSLSVCIIHDVMWWMYYVIIIVWSTFLFLTIYRSDQQIMWFPYPKPMHLLWEPNTRELIIIDIDFLLKCDGITSFFWVNSSVIYISSTALSNNIWTKWLFKENFKWKW